MTFTSVVLPAPLGPISPWIDPCSTSSDTPSTAWTPPKCRWTLSRRRSTDSSSTRPPGRPDDGQPAATDNSLRPEDDHRDQEDAADDVDVGGGGVEDVRQQRDDQRAHDWAEDESAAAEHGKGQDLDRACDAEIPLAWIDVEREVRLQSSRVARHQGADDERNHLVARDVNALAQGGQLVLADGCPRVAQPALCQSPYDEHDDDERGQDEVDSAQRIGLWVAQAETFARDGQVEDHAKPKGLYESDGGDGEEHSAQAEHRQSDQKADHSGEKGCHKHVERTWCVPVEPHQHRHVGADGHEPRSGQRQLTRIQNQKHPRVDDAVEPDLTDQQRVRGIDPDRIAEERDEEVHQIRSRRRVPKRPCGRRISTRNRAAKATPPRALLPRLMRASSSISASRSPPTTAPATLPIPPSTMIARPRTST